MADNPLLSPDHELPKPHDMQLEPGGAETKKHTPPSDSSLDKLPRWLIYLVPAALLLIFAVSIYSMRNQSQEAPQTTPARTTNIPPIQNIISSPASNSETDILNQITKSYPDTISWQKVKHATTAYREYSQDYNPQERILSVYQLNGTGKFNTIETCFSQCEKNFMTQLGWENDRNQSADSPMGSLWGYTRKINGKKQILQLEYINKTMLKDGPMNYKCPCDVEYIFSLSEPF